MQTATPACSVSRERLVAFADHGYWYHTVELAPGIVTAGTYDHRAVLARYGFPESLEGWTVLDVGAADGFFAFEFERRGAARVLAIDRNNFDGSVPTEVSPAHQARYVQKYHAVDHTNRAFADVYDALGVPRGHQLLAARALLDSRIEYRQWSAYDLDRLGETFDLVFCGSLIEHLKNPLSLLEQLAAVTKRLCVVALSSTRPAPMISDGLANFLVKVFRVPLIHPSRALEYVGNESGGSFFHFYPETFRQALLASGFVRVEIHTALDLLDRRKQVRNPHMIYHCYPGAEVATRGLSG